jgi:hemolysin-activating ACP:hemolysin acyltransferase
MSEAEKPQPSAPPAGTLRAFRDKNPYAALGRATSYLMTKPSFANLKFGAWSRTLVGQINRNHYFLVTDGSKIVGFAGWAYVDEARANAFLANQGEASSHECISGDCMIVNAWAADTLTINRFVLKEVRKALVGCKEAYAKRVYPDGRIRLMKLRVTEAVESHVAAVG